MGAAAFGGEQISTIYTEHRPVLGDADELLPQDQYQPSDLSRLYISSSKPVERRVVKWTGGNNVHAAQSCAVRPP